MFVGHFLVDPVSRRQANLSFIFFIITAVCLLIIPELLYFAWIQILQPEFSHQSFVFNQINQNGLFIFLIANLVTGLVNFTINTINVETNTAIILIYAYTAFLTLSGFMLENILSKKYC